jgi:Mrp family chromosome partitioning ATPase
MNFCILATLHLLYFNMAKDLTINGLTESILDLVRRVEALLQRQAADPQQRILVALAGVPGSGKSTVSHALLTELASRGIDDVAVVPMVCYGPFKAYFANQLGRMAFIIPSKHYRLSKILNWLSRDAVLRLPSTPGLS